jgi:hypothetical protein
MHFCQLFILEASPLCNYAELHPRCPVLDPRRFARLDTSRRLDDESMVRLAVEAYRDCGFRGYVGFHYHNEPLLSRDLLLRVIEGIRANVPRARFLLWTNGSLITPRNAAGLRAFDWAVITDYDNRDFGFLHRRFDRLNVVGASFDDRRDGRLPLPREQRCVRPFTEFVVDCYGNVHICCADWQGLASPGNVFTEGLGALAERFAEIRDRVSGSRMSQDAPDVCLHCWRPLGEIDNLVPEVREAALASIRSDALIAERRRARNCLNPVPASQRVADTRSGTT